MRYITQHSDLILLNDDGTINDSYRFGASGVLVIGSLTTDAGAGNAISPTNLQVIYDTDLDGNTVTCLEMVGMGSLTGFSDTLATLTNLEDGYNRLFFPAPQMTGTDAVSGTAGIRYKVLTGAITYNSVEYKVGEVFTTDGTVTATTGTGTFSLWLPQQLERAGATDQTEQFKIKSLEIGDESSDYWNFDSVPAESRNSLTSTDSDWVGWTR